MRGGQEFLVEYLEDPPANLIWLDKAFGSQAIDTNLGNVLYTSFQVTSGLLGLKPPFPKVINATTLRRSINMTVQLAAKFPTYAALDPKLRKKFRQAANSERNDQGVQTATQKPVGTSKVFYTVATPYVPRAAPTLTEEDEQALLRLTTGKNRGSVEELQVIYTSLSAAMALANPGDAQTSYLEIIETDLRVWQKLVKGRTHVNWSARPISKEEKMTGRLSADTLEKITKVSMFGHIPGTMDGTWPKLYPTSSLKCDGPGCKGSTQAVNSLVIVNGVPMTTHDITKGVMHICQSGCNLCAPFAKTLQGSQALDVNETSLNRIKLTCPGAKCQGAGTVLLHELEASMAKGKITCSIAALTMSPKATRTQVNQRSVSASKAPAADPSAFAVRNLTEDDPVGLMEDLLTESDTLFELIGRDIHAVDITLHTPAGTGVEEVKITFKTADIATSVRAALAPHLQSMAEVTSPAPHPRPPRTHPPPCVPPSGSAECAD
jgi:hypothetical protein